jgi:hypothetical protein
MPRTAGVGGEFVEQCKTIRIFRGVDLDHEVAQQLQVRSGSREFVGVGEQLN